VSLPTDIIQFFGPGSVPVVVAGAVLGVFEFGERYASQRAKDALSKWLRSFDIEQTKALPDGTRELFERIFGERHFSLKCFIRSAVFSLGAIAFIYILVVLIYPKEAFEMTGKFLREGEWVPLALWLPWSILVDYVSLLKTRLILSVLSRLRRQHVIIAIAIIAIDFFVYKLLFALGYAFVAPLSIDMFDLTWKEWLTFPLYVNPFYYFMALPFIPHDIELLSILFWAGLAPSLWMWLYILALFVTLALLRSQKLLTWLRWGLDVEKTPFRQTGAVAATLAFIVSAAFILVSLEVSRISAAL
jgi:hypothetical protein